MAVDAAGASVEDLLRFLQFDVVQSPSDHHYLSDMEQVRAVNLVYFFMKNNLQPNAHIYACTLTTANNVHDKQ